ncbi:Coenzyme A disulfide reductase [Clostridium sp. N3C]|uniref:FAD-dependent oxidoreductase n=1 Tax=Clostridium sp. N3C TaxID=1776758 RepID=UPI00092DF374|nr:FAD-dependent oxidoreductase [Clostridium sp. N3C]SCN24320.1 Coenzyme A disulfide reductase [Clostridium sp. N3C]
MGKKILIVGGVAGGASAAARIRRLDESAEIIMFERDEYISFANCGLPYYIGGSIKEREKLLVQTPEAMKRRFKIDVRINSEVISVNTEEKTVKVKTKDGEEYEESYDYILLSPGAKSLKPPIPGIENKKIFTLRNVADTDKIKAVVDSKNIRKAVVIGGGYIGVEMAENLIDGGLEVTLIEAAEHILAPFDDEMSAMAEKELVEHGVNLILKDGVKAFQEKEGSLEVTLSSGTIVKADMAILAIGVMPDTAFLKNSGIQLNERGHIITDEHMRTNVDGVYAVGDAVVVKDFVTGEKAAIPLAGPANRQGRIAADNICGLDTTYKGSQGTSIIKIFDMTAASTGANERTLKKYNIPYKVIYVHPNSHASYYPGASQLTIKLIFNDEGRILGAQVIGYDGVDKTIDVFATVMRLKGTIYDLTELELAYAPPYSSAKSPANMAGFVAENLLQGRMEVFRWEDIDGELNDNFQLIDVRTEIEYENGHLDNAILMPVDDLRNRLQQLDKDKETYLYCQVGLRGYIATRILEQNGFKVKNMTGGYRTYSSSEFKPDLKGKNTNKGDDDKMMGNTEEEKVNKEDSKISKELDATGLCCPGPIMSVKSSLDSLKEGEIIRVTASDPGFYEDIKSWCSKTGNELLELNKEAGKITAIIKKGKEGEKVTIGSGATRDNKTMIVFSGDLDKAIASFIIANGAASMGKKVTMFFTFWGINILRKHDKVKTDKGFVEKVFGVMMPRGSKKLKLSKMNMAGIGPKMIRGIMKKNNVNSLEELIKSAIDNGVEIVACQMSMDLLGLKKEELIDGVKIGGVGYYLGEAEESNVNLFI